MKNAPAQVAGNGGAVAGEEDGHHVLNGKHCVLPRMRPSMKGAVAALSRAPLETCRLPLSKNKTGEPAMAAAKTRFSISSSFSGRLPVGVKPMRGTMAMRAKRVLPVPSAFP